MSLTLVILAAGKGSRFGGDKPLAEVGPSGQSLFEYSVYDAFKAGFKHVIFVVSPKQDTTEYSQRLACYQGRLKVEFVVQKLSDISREISNPASDSRVKPWGTGHAVLVCRDNISNPFVVINADDYYGRLNFKHVGDYLQKKSTDPLVCTLPGYSLKNTLSDSGGVNRGVCSEDSDGYLTSIHEVKNICLKVNDSLHTDPAANNITVNLDSIVSMTFWGFHPSFFDVLERAFQSFLADTADLSNDEFYIPDAVNLAIKSGEVRARLIPTSEKWKGVTYAEDLSEVRDFMNGLTDAGHYPASMHRL